MPSAIDSEFDVHAQHLKHVAAGLPPILAAVAALTDAVEFHSVKTVAETLSLLSSSSEELRSKCDLPVLLRSGMAAFGRWLVLLLERPDAGATLNPPFSVQLPAEDFDARKVWIVEACRAYVSEGVEAKNQIATTSQALFQSQRNLKFLIPVCDVVVTTILVELAKSKKYFEEHLRATHSELPTRLQDFNIPVTEVTPQATALYLQSGATIVLTAASLVGANATVSAMTGTYQAAVLARAASCPFYIAIEAYKLSSDFFTEKVFTNARSKFISTGKGFPPDFTPPDLITSFLTEKGPVTPEQITGQYVKTWF